MDKRQVILIAPIKDPGIHLVVVRLHPEVDATIRIDVPRSLEESEIQASGKSFQELATEAEAEMDISALFDDIGGAAMDEQSGLLARVPPTRPPPEAVFFLVRRSVDAATSGDPAENCLLCRPGA